MACPALRLCVMDQMHLSRDLLPIPLDAGLDAASWGSTPFGSSAASAGRGAKRDRQNRWLRDGLRSLHALGGQGRRVAPDAELTGARRAVVRRLAGLCGSVSFPDSHHDSDASWTMLQGLRPGYAEAESEGGRAVYQPGKMSLPVGGAGRAELASIAPESLRAMLETGHGLLRDTVEVQQLFESNEGNLRYLDPKLARPGYDFGRALSGLFEAGAVEVTSEGPEEEMGMCSVQRKDDKLRVIADARAANIQCF